MFNVLLHTFLHMKNTLTVISISLPSADLRSCAFSLTLRYFRMQWFAVRTHLGDMSVPPQNTS